MSWHFTTKSGGIWGVLLQGDNVSDGFFLAIIAAHDKLEFDVHRKTPPGLSGGCMMQATLPEFVEYPQHLHALLMLRAKPLTPKTTI